MASLEIDSVSRRFYDIFLRPPIFNFVCSESGLAYVTFPNLKVVDLAVATRRLFLNLKLLTPHLHRTADRCAALLLLVKKGKTRGCNRLSNYRDPGTYSKRSPGMIQPCIESSN